MVAFGIDGLIVKERSFLQKVNFYIKGKRKTEHINIFKVSNINTALKYLKTKDFWISAFDGNLLKILPVIIGKVKMFYFSDQRLRLKTKT